MPLQRASQPASSIRGPDAIATEPYSPAKQMPLQRASRSPKNMHKVVLPVCCLTSSLVQVAGITRPVITSCGYQPHLECGGTMPFLECSSMTSQRKRGG